VEGLRPPLPAHFIHESLEFGLHVEFFGGEPAEAITADMFELW
jgi:hypothetical protein